MSSRESATTALLDAMAGQPLRAVLHDLEAGVIELRAERGGVRFCAVRSSTLLGPWDGSSAIVESLRLVLEDAERCCIELRLQYPEVPRRYRVVCGGVEAL